MMLLSKNYGGCSPAQADPPPVYSFKVTVRRGYFITQTNGVTDLELFIATSSGAAVGHIDNEWGGYTEAVGYFLDPGSYLIGVYNNGAPHGIGSQDGPFTLNVDPY